MIRVCLVNPCPNDLMDVKVFPPLGLLYVAAATEKAGYKVKVCDVCLDGEDIPDGYDIYAVTCNITQVGYITEWLPQHRERNPDAVYAIGGPYIGTTGRGMKFNWALIGEGEERFPRWVEFVDDCMSLWGKGPIGFMKGIIAEPIDIDNGIFPARHLIDIHQYKYSINGRKATPMITMRGCPFRCAFCAKRPGDDKVRFRKTDDILAEVKDIIDMGFEAIRFYDDTFNLKPERTIELCKALEPYSIFWKAEIRADRVSYALIEAMAVSGCKEVAIGVESGSQKILDNVNKKTAVKQNTTAIKMFQEYGIKTRAYLILGLPGEDHETIKATRNWLKTAKPDSFALGIFMPYVGSDIAAHPEKYDIQFPKDLKPEELFYRTKPGEYQCFVSTAALSSHEILEYREKLSRDFGEYEAYSRAT